MTYSDRHLQNPINWSFKVGRLFDIDIRIHLLFIIGAFVLIGLERGAAGEGPTPPFSEVIVDALGVYAILFLVVLLHEFGHCFGSRKTGGEADEILLWPLGGLAYVSPPHNPRAHMITTVAGPLVNVIICAVCTAVLVGWTGELGVIPWNPFRPLTPFNQELLLTTGQFWVLRVYAISYILFLFNVLLPFYPFDGGRMLQAWLWPRKGYERSMMIATTVGMIGAIVLGVVGLIGFNGSMLLLGVAVFGYLSCWQTRKMLQHGDMGSENEFGYDFSQGYRSLERANDEARGGPGFFKRRQQKRLAKQAQRHREADERQRAEVERILKKVSDHGLRALSARERRILGQETARRQDG